MIAVDARMIGISNHNDLLDSPQNKDKQMATANTLEYVKTYTVINGQPEVVTWNDRKQIDRYLNGKDGITFCGILLIVEECSAVDVVVGDWRDPHYQLAKDYIQENML